MSISQKSSEVRPQQQTPEWIVLKASLLINAPPDKVSATFYRGENIPKIFPSMKNAVQSENYPEPGSTMAFTYQLVGVMMDMTLTTEIHTPVHLRSRMEMRNRKYTSSLSNVTSHKVLSGIVEWKFEAAEGGTRATASYEYQKPRGRTESFVERTVVRSIAQRNLEMSVATLRRLAEAG